MVKYKPQIIRRLSAAVMSLSLLLGITSCDVLIEEIVEAYYSNETGDIEAVRETEVTFELRWGRAGCGGGGGGLITKSCLALCDLKDYSPPGSSVHGISQARILKWVVISFSRGSS